MILPVARNEARIVLITMFSCVTEELKMTGTASLPTFLTPGWLGENCGLSIIPCFFSPGSCMRNWNSPPMATPIAAPMIGSGSRGPRNRTEAIMIIFNSTGEREGVRKDRSEYSIPMARAARPMNMRYGNMTLVSSTERVYVSSSIRNFHPKAITLTR